VCRLVYLNPLCSAKNGSPFLHTTKFHCIFHVSIRPVKFYYYFAFAILGQPCSFGCLVYRLVHNSIMPSKLKVTLNSAASKNINKVLQKPHVFSTDSILSKPINKNSILSKYDEELKKLGFSEQVTTTKKGEPTYLHTNYPSIFQLICDCSMKPDNNHYYRVKDLRSENVIVILLKSVDGYLSDTCIKKLHCLNQLFNEITTNVYRLRNFDFSKLREPRIGFADQQEIQASRVDMATAGIIRYLLHPGMLIQYVKGKYVGESRNVSQIINDVLPYIDHQDVVHINWILTNGIPSYINFKEALNMKSFIIKKGNQAIFKMYPEAVEKTMNKEDKHSHLLSVKLWVLHFSPWCCHATQGMQIKPGKNPRVIFDASTKGSPHEVVLNKFTPTKFEANINFGHAKMNLLCRIYNWRVSCPREIIFLALADITACFRFPRIHADLTGAFGLWPSIYSSWLRAWSLVQMLLPAVGSLLEERFNL
jgi:hypothetical protein